MRAHAVRSLPLLTLAAFVLLVGACPDDGDNPDGSDAGGDGGGNPDGGSPDGGGDPDGGGYDGGGGDGGGGDGGGGDGGGGGLFSVNPLEIDFEHVVTETSCPQIVGELILTNLVDVGLTCTATVTGDAETRIDFEPQSGVLSMGALSGTSYGVFFNCSDTSPFDGVISIECADAAEDLVDAIDVPVTGNVHYRQ